MVPGRKRAVTPQDLSPLRDDIGLRVLARLILRSESMGLTPSAQVEAPLVSQAVAAQPSRMPVKAAKPRHRAPVAPTVQAVSTTRSDSTELNKAEQASLD